MKKIVLAFLILLIPTILFAEVFNFPIKKASKIYLTDGRSVEAGVTSIEARTNTAEAEISSLNLKAATLEATKADKSYVDATMEALIISLPEIRTGRAEFNSITGRTITFSTPMPDDNYQITIQPEDDSLYDVGAYYFKNKTVNGFTIYNSGENTVAYFDYIAIKK